MNIKCNTFKSFSNKYLSPLNFTYYVAVYEINKTNI